DGLTGDDSLRLQALGYGAVTVNVVTDDGNDNPKRIPEPGMAISLIALGMGAAVKIYRKRS
ncbi:MAG: hypothetical protein ACFCBU_15335, partial [Cyanophyceae cyanobacterium]